MPSLVIDNSNHEGVWFLFILWYVKYWAIFVRPVNFFYYCVPSQGKSSGTSTLKNSVDATSCTSKSMRRSLLCVHARWVPSAVV